MIKIWFQRDRNVPTKINIDPDLDVDDLKQEIFDKTDIGQYLTTYNGKILKLSGKVPQNTTDDMPIVFTKIVNVPPPVKSETFISTSQLPQSKFASDVPEPKPERLIWGLIEWGLTKCWLMKPEPLKPKPQEFADPGTCEEPYCQGRPCAKCHKCRDWHFSGNQKQWIWIRNYKNWKKVDTDRWHGAYEFFTKRHGASCLYDYTDSDSDSPYNKDVYFTDFDHVLAQIYNVPTTTTFSEETPIPELGVETPQPEELRVELNRINDWNFNIFRTEAISGERPLTAITYRIFQERDLIRTFSIEPHKLLSYLFALEDSYQQVPYHNKLHGADVCQSMHVLLNSSGIKDVFNEFEILAAIFAAVVHDVHHPGLTNPFLIQTKSDLAILYNDESVLENHHLAVAFKLLQADERNIFSNLSAEQMETLRKRVVDMVLATDMAKHKTLLADFQNLVAAKKMSGNEYLTLESYDDRILVLKNMIHCADLSNMTKPLDTYSKWIDRLMVEFWKQGDAERDLGLDISPMCVRSPTTKDKHQ
ncbi:unnamed protein product, partial [Adineta steineri]